MSNGLAPSDCQGRVTVPVGDPVLTFQMRIVGSALREGSSGIGIAVPLAETSCRPSGLNARLSTTSGWLPTEAR